MALTEIPSFPFPRARTLVDVVRLIDNPEAARFLASLENARESLNAEIRNHNGLKDLDANLYAAKADRDKAAALFLLAEAEAEALTTHTEAVTRQAHEDLEMALDSERAQHGRWLEDTKEETLHNLSKSRDLAADAQADRDRAAVTRQDVEALKAEYEGKLNGLQDALAGL